MVAPHLRRVFLAHAVQDREKVRQFASLLRERGFEPWLDEDMLLPGADWQTEIDQAIRASSGIVVFLSEAPPGFWSSNFEILCALKSLEEQPDQLVVLVRLDQSEIPWPFAHLKSVAVSEPEKLLEILEAESKTSQWSKVGGTTDLRIVFDGEMEPAQVTGVLTALSNYFRACGGIGFVVDFELERAAILENADA